MSLCIFLQLTSIWASISAGGGKPNIMSPWTQSLLLEIQTKLVYFPSLSSFSPFLPRSNLSAIRRKESHIIRFFLLSEEGCLQWMSSCFHHSYHLSCTAPASSLIHPASAFSEHVHTLSWLSVPGDLSAHSLLWRILRCFPNTESGWMHLGTSISCSSATISASRCTRFFAMWLEVHPGMWVSLLLLYQANISFLSLFIPSAITLFFLQGK